MDFLVISGCDTSLYHSQGGTMLLSLCNPDRTFGICMLTLRELELLQAFTRLMSISSNFLFDCGFHSPEH